MPNFSNHILTRAGAAAILEAQTGRTFTFTRMAAGSGNGVGDPRDLTDLAAPRIDVGITAAERDPVVPDQLRVRGIFTNLLETVGWQFRELGLFCRIDNDPEVLYSYVMDTGTGDLFPPYDGQNPVIIYPTMIVIIAPNIPINAIIVIGADFNCENIGPETVGPGWFKERVGDTFRFRRAAAGFGITLIEDAVDPFSITISQNVLALDLDLYVPLTHPDLPAGGLGFATIQDALDYLYPIAIPPNRLATIHVQGITLNQTASIVVEHKDSENIAIVGEDAPILTATSITVATGITTLFGPVGTFNGVSIGDFIGVRAAPGNLAYMISGIWPVNSVAPDGTAVNYLSIAPAGATAGATAQVYLFKTRLVFPAGIGGIAIRGSGLRNLANMVLEGNPTNAQAHGLNVGRGDVSVNRVGAYGWGSPTNLTSAGFLCSSSAYLRLIDCYSGRNGDGIFLPSDAEFTRVITNANYRRGVFLNGCNLTAVNLTACQNIQYGVGGDGKVLLSGLYAFNNGGVDGNQGGIHLVNGSSGQLFGAASFLDGNAGFNVFLNVLSSLTNSGAPTLSYASSTNTPAGGAIDSKGCIFIPTQPVAEEEEAETLPEL